MNILDCIKKVFLKNIARKHEGSALLISVLLMGGLMTVSVFISSLVMREINVTRSLLDSGKAYYAAQSGIEHALYNLDNELSGWHVENEVDRYSDDSLFKYSVKNTCNSYPCLDDSEYDLVNVPLQVYYDVLELNETLTIPLFTVEDGKIKSVKDFTVEFFPAFDPSTDLKVKSISGWDVLRWKVFGIRNVAGSYVTESIGDLTAFAAGSSPKGNDVFANVDRPSWFGTQDCDQMTNRGNGVSDIQCVEYDTSVILQSIDGTVCLNTQARDYWGYTNGEVKAIYDCYDISKFMEENQANYNGATGLNHLSLTNMMNPLVFDDEKYRTMKERENMSRLYFRVETFSDDVVREYAVVESEGFSGSSKQSIKVLKRRGGFMPVFNFSIYSTSENS